MPIHSNKYFQLIKMLRSQKQLSEKLKMQQKMRQHQLDYIKTEPTEQNIAVIIDKDNSIQLDDKDKKTTEKESLMTDSQIQYTRLWKKFTQSSSTINLANQALPIHKKLAQSKDQILIDTFLQESAQQCQQNNSLVDDLKNQIKEICQQISCKKNQICNYEKQIEECDKQMVQLKAEFNNQQKKINQRSTKYKEEKSKDMMMKNINHEDVEMRKAVVTRIKLNQELDLGFELQRRRKFNQAKQAINQKNKKIKQKIEGVRLILKQKLKKQESLKHEKEQLQLKNDVIQKQTVFFLRKLVKCYKYHSKGIEWMIKKLLQFKENISKEDLPQQLSWEDKKFIQLLFKERNSKQDGDLATPKSKYHTKLPKRVNLFMHFKTQQNITEPRQEFDKDFSSFIKSNSQIKRREAMTVYYDIESDKSSSNTHRSNQHFSKQFNINSKSLKKIYENTSDVISKFIKNKDWNYESCKVMADTQLQGTYFEEGHFEKKIIDDRIKQKFMKVNQINRRNNIKRLIFGDKCQQK